MSQRMHGSQEHSPAVSCSQVNVHRKFTVCSIVLRSQKADLNHVAPACLAGLQVRSSAGDFAKAVGSSSGEFFLAGPDGDWLVVFDRTSDTADITDSIASIIIDYNRKHPQWHYPKATKERHA